MIGSFGGEGGEFFDEGVVKDHDLYKRMRKMATSDREKDSFSSSNDSRRFIINIFIFLSSCVTNPCMLYLLSCM